MSHELRSPLHGILASTELLYGTPLSVTQTDLCDTVEICGQTLLDTLSQILDFSKVNNFLRDTHTTVAKERKRSKSSASTGGNPRSGIHAGSSLHVYSECNVAALCEEALDVISMSFRQASAFGSPGVTPLTEFGSLAASQTSTDNAVVVDFVAPNENWMFLCSPGAIRRIVMNLVGNSFKYTERGSISVELGLHSSGEDASKQHIITISVNDTGRGMSDEFMRKKLFVPFSQENTVAPGSGLGLSLVQGIVKSLDGKIDVWSNVGRGTKMEVSFPLKRTSEDNIHVNGQLRPTSTSWLDSKTYKFLSPRTAMHKRLQDSIRYYMKSWWNMKEIDITHDTAHDTAHNTTHDTTQAADFIFLDSEDLPGILEQQPQRLAVYAVVLSQIASTPDVRSLKTPTAEIFEPLRVPFGPKKLLKTLHACIKRSLDVEGPLTGVESTSSLLKFATAGLNGKTLATNTPGLRPRLTPENRRYSSNSNTATLAQRDHPLRQASQPVTQLKTDLTVLCVDDNAINLRLLNTFAKKLGFDIIESAENGLQAYEIMENSSRGFDVVFMDLTG
jgi:signal transduction histidine kinase